LDNVFRFGGFEADRTRYQLWADSRPIKLERIPLELLFLLLENRGKLVSRIQIVATLWGDDVFLDTERSINTAVRKIRKALKDDPHKPQFIETVVGQGYRFIASLCSEIGVRTPQLELRSGAATLAVTTNIDSTQIRLHSFSVETRGGATVLTGDIEVGNLALGRLPLLELQIPVDLTGPPNSENKLLLKLHGVRVTLTAQAAQALQAFSISVLQDGLRTSANDPLLLVDKSCGKQAFGFATESLSSHSEAGSA